MLPPNVNTTPWSYIESMDTIEGEYGEVIADNVESPEAGHLIAAAPDLYAACIALWEALNASVRGDIDHSLNHGAIEAGKEAIAKAQMPTEELS